MSTELNTDRARIYVSFADEDRARAMELVRWLNDSGWRVVADDRHSFAPGETWSAPRRLRACDVVLCVITPGWLVSDLPPSRIHLVRQARKIRAAGDWRALRRRPAAAGDPRPAAHRFHPQWMTEFSPRKQVC
jgi:hypothetical protein